MAVAATTYAIANALSVQVARPGAADASGTILLAAISETTDNVGGVTKSGWTTLYQYAFSRASTYGRSVYCALLGKIGTASEAATYTFVASLGTAQKTVISAAVYRVTDPVSVSSISTNIGAKSQAFSAFTTYVNYPSLSLSGSGSIVIDTASMLAGSDADAASLGLRSGDTQVILHRLTDTDSPAYFLSAGHGYRSNQSGTISAGSDTTTGNLGAEVIAVEILQSASGGGSSGETGQVLMIGG